MTTVQDLEVKVTAFFYTERHFNKWFFLMVFFSWTR